MKSNNKIYSFFIIIALLFWNPISYFLIYGNTAVYSEISIHIFYWIVFISGILLILLIQKNMLNDRIKNIVFSMALIGILFSTFVIIDRAVSLVTNDEMTQVHKQEWLIFEPNSKAHYQTVEFDYVVNINSLGLRDKEFNIEKGGKYRILCFGDSWTFGWGVNVENSWPKKLGQYLLANGFENIEVINCGYPGGYTSTYKKSMGKIVPLLKPDLVLVGVLQLDDLAQLYQNNVINSQSGGKIKIKRKIKSVMKSYLKYSLKSIFISSNPVEIKLNWGKASKSMMENFSPMQNISFYALNDSVRSLFRSGDLNPGLVRYYINFSDRIAIFNNPNHPATKFSIQEMDKDIKGMRDVCYKNNSDLIFINIPINNFTGHNVIRAPSDILNSYYETHNNIDPIYRSVANANNLPYIEMTNHFIGLQNKSEYLFKYDGHPNEKGYEEIAKYIGKQLIELNHLIKR